MSKKIKREENRNIINDFDKNIFDEYSKELLNKLEQIRIESLKRLFKNEFFAVVICVICCIFDLKIENILEYNVNDVRICAILSLLFLIVYISTQIKYENKTKSPKKNIHSEGCLGDCWRGPPVAEFSSTAVSAETSNLRSAELRRLRLRKDRKAPHLFFTPQWQISS